jgi:hypothetical protein
MLDFKTQSQLVDATATIMRSYLRAATTTFAASASRSMSLWTEMLETASRAPAGPPQPAARALVPTPWPTMVQTWWLGPSVTFWAPFADWSVWSRAPFPAWSGWLPQVPPSASRATLNGAAQRAADDGGFASYRSAGGHASTQVIIGS